MPARGLDLAGPRGAGVPAPAPPCLCKADLLWSEVKKAKGPQVVGRGTERSAKNLASQVRGSHTSLNDRILF